MTDTEAAAKTEVSKDKVTEETAANGASAADKETKKEDTNGTAPKAAAEKSEAATEAKNGDEKKEPVDEAVVMAQVKRQLEHYFGDYSLPKDKFLRKTIEESEDGWVTLDIMLKFERLARITNDKEVILKSVKDSKVLETNSEKMAVRRLPSLPIPEFNDEFKKAQIAKSVYCKGFEKEKTTLDDLIKFFWQYDGVVNVIWRTYGPKPFSKDNRHFKGSTFVTFEDKEAAQKFLDLEEVKSPEGEVLIRKWQQEYFDEKDKEMEEKRKSRQNVKKENKKAKEALEANEENSAKMELHTGTILVLEGFANADTKREDIKNALVEKHGMKAEGELAFIYFNKGEKEAKLRFSAEDAAKDLAKKIADSLKEGEKFTINEDGLEVKVLEGQEETDFLDKCKADIAQQKGRNRKGHKRHSGRPGYKGPPKRQRQN